MSTDLEKLTYISVDVEASDTRPDRGVLLTIGAVAMNGYGHVIDDFYIRINRTLDLDASWYNEKLPAKTDTQEWWRSQEQYVKDEAYMSKTAVRVPAPQAGHLFRNWVLGFGEDWTHRVFVANPVSFDKLWIDHFFMEVGLKEAFHYRSLCLRSMAFGVGIVTNGEVDFHASAMRTHAPTFPHHALSDAFAQLQDLADMLGYSSNISELDEPTYENAPVLLEAPEPEPEPEEEEAD